MAYAYTLGALVEEVDKIVATVHELEQAMRHASPSTVDALRIDKAQLEALIQHIMTFDVTSGLSLSQLLSVNRDCLNDCLGILKNDGLPSIGRTRK